MTPIEIPLSRKKLILIMAGAIVFVAASFWLQIIASRQSGEGRGLIGNPMALKVVGAAGILFFGLALYFSVKKLLDKSPGLVIADDGITDHTSGISAGFIPWKDIVEISEVSVFNQKFLMLLLSNPQAYINKQTDFMKKKSMKLNLKNYGSPISISSNTLKCDFNELKALLMEQLALRKGKGT